MFFRTPFLTTPMFALQIYIFSLSLISVVNEVLVKAIMSELDVSAATANRLRRSKIRRLFGLKNIQLSKLCGRFWLRGSFNAISSSPLKTGLSISDP